MELVSDYPVLLILTILSLLAIIILYRLLVAPLRLLSSHGIKGPTPLPVVGNLFGLQKVGVQRFVKQNVEEYGLVFGYYIGTVPKIAVTDIEVARGIMVKEFESFVERGFLGAPDIIPKAIGIEPGLVVADVKAWRPGRRALTPSFSSMKMKLMLPIIKESSDVLIDIMGEYAENGKSVDVFKAFSSFTLEIMIATAFGQRVAIQRGEADKLTQAIQTFFLAAEEGSSLSFAILTFLNSFSCLRPLLRRLIRNSKAGDAIKLIYETAVRLIEARKKNTQPREVKDLLQLMIDATVDEDDDGNKCSAKKLTTRQIAGFSVDFLNAGYETTATTLGFIAYLLATHPDVQEKLQNKIDTYFDQNPEGSLYDAAQEIKFLEMVIFESLRLYTPVPNTQRHCCKTVTVSGVTIPKGADVLLPPGIIHQLPQYWPDPHKFDPERFSAEAKVNQTQLAHMPFGWGPRNCIGLRFALLNAKIALIETLRRYTLARGPETVAEMKTKIGITLAPVDKVMIKILPRN